MPIGTERAEGTVNNSQWRQKPSKAEPTISTFIPVLFLPEFYRDDTDTKEAEADLQ